MSARDNILARLLGAPRQPLPAPDVAGHFAGRREPSSPAERLARFRANIEAAHAEVFECAADAWPELLGRLCRDKGVQTLACPPVGPVFEKLGTAHGLPELLPFPESFREVKEKLFAGVEAGISRAAAAVAETGSLLLVTGPEEPRTLSLVPPIHFVLLDATRIHANLQQALAEEGWNTGGRRLPTNLLLVSGPSKTADIQQTLAYGAHGPKELVVIALTEGEAA